MELGHLDHLESPWGNAGGVIKSISEVEAMSKTGVGWLEAGSFTLDELYGNDRDPLTGEFIIDVATGEPIRLYFHDPAAGATYNSLGMPNKGMDVIEKQIPEMVDIAHTHNKPLVINVAPVTEDPLSEARELVARAYEAGTDAVLLNAGCPNVITEDGGRREILSTNPRALAIVLYGLRKITEKLSPIFLRVSPMPTYDQTKTILRIVEASKSVSAIFTPNSFDVPIPHKDGKPVIGVQGETTGKSGPGTAGATYQRALWAKEILNGSKINVVRSGGIADCEAMGVSAAAELKKTLDLGILAAGTTFYFESGDWQEDTHRLLEGIAA